MSTFNKIREIFSVILSIATQAAGVGLTKPGEWGIIRHIHGA